MWRAAAGTGADGVGLDAVDVLPGPVSGTQVIMSVDLSVRAFGKHGREGGREREREKETERERERERERKEEISEERGEKP